MTNPVSAADEAALTVIATFTAASGKIDALRADLERLAIASSQDDGCLAYDLRTDIRDANVLAFVERWTSEAKWLAHLNTPHVQAFAGRMDDLVSSSTMHALR